MPDSLSLQEFLAQARRSGPLQSVLGPDYMQKQAYFTVDTSTNVFTTTYGNKVWHALNNQTRIFNALPRVTWGRTAGWRIRTDRGASRSRPVTETGALPTVDVSNIVQVSSLPRIVGTTFGASVKSIFTTQLEGGVGDVVAMEMENSSIDHAKEINQELLAGSAYLVSAGGATSFTVPASVSSHFKIGDAIAMDDADAAGFDRTTGTAVTVNPGTGAVTVATGTAIADGDIVFIYSRAGFTSLDDLIWADTTGTSGPGGGAAEVRAYDLTYSDRVAGTWNAGAYVGQNAGVGRDLTLTLLDNAILNSRQNGGDPNLIVMGHDQYYRLERLLNTQQRYVGTDNYQVGIGNEKTFPGTETGMVLATYQRIPILVDPDVPASVATDDTVLGRNVYVLDTRNLEVAVAAPTQYVENRDYFAAGAMVVRGLFYTMGELRCTSFWTQSAIRDLNS